jgi:DNA-binding GntR family transcriptional regulator
MDSTEPMNKLQISGERSTSQQVVETIRRAIFRGDLKLGERLVEANLARTLNVSITPVRQAFSQLATEGLIHVVPYKGTNVVQITEEFIEEVYSIRIKLELMAVELSLPYITSSDCDKLEAYAKQMDILTQTQKFEEFAEIDILFHGFFYEHSRHELLLEIWRMIQSRIQLLQTYGRTFNHQLSKGEVENRHLKIIHAIRQKDLSKSIQLMKEHIEAGKKMMLDHYLGRD